MKLADEAERFATRYLQKDPDPDFLIRHTEYVRQYALMLAKVERADIEVCEVAAILHDIGHYKGRETHHQTGHDLAQRFLDRTDVPEQKKEKILQCVLKHRTQFASGDNPTEVRILQCADVLAVLFDEKYQKESREKYPAERILKRFEKAMGKLTLDSARRIALPRIEELTRQL